MSSTASTVLKTMIVVARPRRFIRGSLPLPQQSLLRVLHVENDRARLTACRGIERGAERVEARHLNRIVRRQHAEPRQPVRDSNERGVGRRVIEVVFQTVQNAQHFVRVLYQRGLFVQPRRSPVRDPADHDKRDGAYEKADVDRRLYAADPRAGLERHRTEDY